MSSRFSHYPDRPNNDECKKAFYILCYAHDTTSSFLDTFNFVRRERKAKGTPTHEEQDLLRAMLVFASSALDSLAKQLVLDVLPLVLKKNKIASQMFKSFVEKRLMKNNQTNYKILADVIGDMNPHRRMVELYVESLTSNSLQSKDAILKIGAAFDIKSEDLTNDPAVLAETFNARNKIVHEMDVNFEHPSRNRTPRSRKEMVAYTNRVFRVAKSFLLGVDKKISA